MSQLKPNPKQSDPFYYGVAIVTVYLAGLLQGLTMVSFPASSTILKHLHGFTDAQYGSIFIPEVLFTILGAFSGSYLTDKIGLKYVLWIALLANALSQIALGGSYFLSPERSFICILTGTGLMGLGFGLSAAPINTLPQRFFSHPTETAVVAMHTFLGSGLALGPLVLGWWFNTTSTWLGFPVVLLIVSMLLLGLTLLGHFPAQQISKKLPEKLSTIIHSPVFWLFMLIGVLYAFAEGTLSNWAVIYLSDDRHLPLSVASMALAGFWGALAMGRLIISAIIVRVDAYKVWLVLPLLILSAFLLLPYVHTSISGIGLFVWAGFACSAFFPLTVGLVSDEFPDQVAWVSSMTIVAVMFGVGLGSFIIGPLHSLMPFAMLYRLSAFYPAAALVLVLIVLKKIHHHFRKANIC